MEVIDMDMDMDVLRSGNGIWIGFCPTGMQHQTQSIFITLDLSQSHD